MKRFLLNAFQKRFACPQKPVPAQVRSILVLRQHDQLGDFLLSTPVFRELKAKFPQCRISVVIRPYVAPAARANPYIDEIIAFEPKLYRWKPAALISAVARIRKQYDLALVLSTPSRSLTSDLAAFISGAHFCLGMAPRIEGDPLRYDFLYHATAARPHPRIHQALENLTILRPLGIDSQNGREELFLQPSELAWAADKLRELHKQDACSANQSAIGPVLLLPGAGKKQNRWPVSSFVELGRRIGAGRSLLVLWGPGQEQVGCAVFQGLREFGVKTVENTSIRQLAALARLSALSICNDTGDLHICAAAGARTLALFGPTDPGIYCPLGKHVHCLRSPTGCMEDLDVETVFQKSTGLP